MKNQNDLIFSIVAIVVFLIVAGVAFGMKPQPTQPSPPESVNTSKPVLPTAVQPVMVNSLPSAGSTGGGGGAGAIGGGGAPSLSSSGMGGGGVKPGPKGMGAG